MWYRVLSVAASRNLLLLETFNYLQMLKEQPLPALVLLAKQLLSLEFFLYLLRLRRKAAVPPNRLLVFVMLLEATAPAEPL